MPEPNGGFVCGVVDDIIWVIGGTNWEGGEKHWLSVMHAFDPVRRHWTTGTDLLTVAYAVQGRRDTGRDHAFGFVGGSTGTGGNPAQVWSAGSGHWIETQGLPTDQSRVLAAGGVMGNVFVIVGGTDDPANIAGLKKTALSFDGKNGHLDSLPDFPGKPFGTAASTVLSNSLYIFGGANWAGTAQDVVNTDSAYAFSMPDKVWRKLRPLPYAVRGLSALPLGEKQIYLAGGYKGDAEGFTDEAFIYDVVANTYVPAPSLPYRAMVTLVECGGYAYCLGGEDKQKSRTAACYRLPLQALAEKPAALLPRGKPPR